MYMHIPVFGPRRVHAIFLPQVARPHPQSTTFPDPLESNSSIPLAKQSTPHPPVYVIGAVLRRYSALLKKCRALLGKCVPQDNQLLLGCIHFHAYLAQAMEKREKNIKKNNTINSFLVAFSSTHMLRKPWTNKMSEKEGEKVRVCTRD